MEIIKVDNITKDYGNNKGVFDVSFTVNKGEVMGFLGPNGAGKTTTIRQLMGFTKPNKGSVRILGRNCFSEAGTIAENLGYLPGEIAFMDNMTGWGFIKFIAKMKKVSDLSRAKELMDFFQLDASGKIRKMSKGMKQKIAIICCFMTDADILILDEPTSGLDPLMQNKFVELILAEKAKGKTILMSSHLFEEVEKTCDRAVIIKDGRIVAVEDMEKLRQNKSRLVSVRFKKTDDAQAFAAAWPKAKVDHDSVRVEIAGDFDGFLEAVSHYGVADMDIHTQSLEELFMCFYGGEQK